MIKMNKGEAGRVTLYYAAASSGTIQAYVCRLQGRPVLENELTVDCFYDNVDVLKKHIDDLRKISGVLDGYSVIIRTIKCEFNGHDLGEIYEGKQLKSIADVVYVGGSVIGAALIASNASLNVLGYVLFLVASIAGIYLLTRSNASKSLLIVTVYYCIVNFVGIIRYWS